MNLPGVDKIFTVEEGKGVTGQTGRKDALNGHQTCSLPIAASILCVAAGCWFLPTAPSAPGRARSAGPTPGRRCITIRTAIYAPAMCVPGASRTRSTPASLPLPTTTPRFCPTRPEEARRLAMACCRAESERGVCRVLCFHPDHSLTLAGMEVADIVRVVRSLDGGVHRPGCASGNSSCADLRKSRRHDGGQQSSSALPDLGHGTYSRRTRGRGGQPARLSPATRRLPAL